MNRFITRLVSSIGLAIVTLAAGDARAAEYDLYTSSSTATINGALYQVDTSHPTGTGFIDSFLRIQQKGYEQGYNTSARPVQFDEKTDPNYTRNLSSAEAAVVTLNGTQYRAFLLDINEPTASDKEKITLDQLEIYVSDTASISNGYSDASGGSLAGAVKIYDMDAGTDNFLNLSYKLNGGGSGTGDMIVYIPNALFGNYGYIYLYSQFGCADRKGNGECKGADAGKFSSAAGFEEWWALSSTNTTTSAVPEPSSLLLLGTGAVALFKRLRTRRA